MTISKETVEEMKLATKADEATEKHDGVPLYHEYKKPDGIQIKHPPIMQGIQPTIQEIHLQFDKISVGTGDNKHTFDLVKIFKGLEHIADISQNDRT